MITVLLIIDCNYYATKIEQEKYLPDNDVFHLGTEKRNRLMDNNMLLETFIQMSEVSEKVLEEQII